MKTFHLQLSCSAILLFLIVWGCQTKDALPTVISATLQSDSVVCDRGDHHTFDLESIPVDSTNSDAAYGWDLKTEDYPYNLKDCLCKVKRYELGFNYLPDSSLIFVLTESGDTLDFYLDYDSTTNQYVIVIDTEQLEDHETKVFVGFDETVTPIPTAKKGGGLCIVDNINGLLYNGPDTLTPRLKPFFTTDTISTNVFERHIIIPEAMTTDYTSSIQY